MESKEIVAIVRRFLLTTGIHQSDVITVDNTGIFPPVLMLLHLQAHQRDDTSTGIPS